MNQTFLWKENPFLRILFDILLGILLAFGIDAFSLNFWLLIALITAFYILILNLKTVSRYQFRYGISVALHITLILLIYTHTSRYIDKIPTNHFSHKKGGKYVVEIQVLKGQNTKWNNYVGAVRFIQTTDNHLVQTSGNCLIHLPTKAVQPKEGDIILLQDSFFQIKATQQPTTFDYTKYLANQQIFHEFYLNDNEWFNSNVNANNFVEKLAFKVKAWVVEYLNQHYKEPTHKGILQALLIGDRSELSSEIKQSFSETGTIHVLAISGLHLGIIYLMLTTFFKPLSKTKFGKIFSTVFILSILWMFALITGFSPSVSRSATMFSLFAFGELLNRRKSSINSWAATCCILLIINPLNLTQVGFQFSFLAVLGILIGFKPIRRYLISSSWLMSKIIELLIVSFCAQMAILPLSAYYFHQFPVYFLLSNLLIVPCITIVMYSTVIGILFGFIPYISLVFTFVTNAYLWTIINLNSLFGKLPYALIPDWYLKPIQVLTLYMLIVVISIFCKYPKRKWFYITLSAFTFLILLNGLTSLKHHQQQILVSAKIDWRDIPMLIQGEKCIVFSDVDSCSVQTNKNIDSWLKQRFVTEIQNLNGITPFWFETSGQRILFAKSTLEAKSLSKKIKPDVVVINGKIFLVDQKISSTTNTLDIPFGETIDDLNDLD